MTARPLRLCEQHRAQCFQCHWQRLLPLALRRRRTGGHRPWLLEMLVAAIAAGSLELIHCEGSGEGRRRRQ